MRFTVAFGIAAWLAAFSTSQAECLYDEIESVQGRVQEHLAQILTEACPNKTISDLDFKYFGIWSPNIDDDTELTAQQAFYIQDDADNSCQKEFVRRAISSASEGMGPNCSRHKAFKAEWYPDADSGPSLLFYLSRNERAPSNREDKVLYRFKNGQLFDGNYGRIAEIQAAIATKLRECNTSRALQADGKFGPGTKRAIASLANCTTMASQLPQGSEALNGAFTSAMWRALFGSKPEPDVSERTIAILLAFEATDYTRAEWNFCQNKPFYDPAGGQRSCYSNDKGSYITWGPNGATAGHGQEALAIAALVDREAPHLLDQSFGSEANSLRRAMRMDNSSNGDLERFLCGKWINPESRKAWKDGFSKFGSLDKVRQVYQRLYRAANFDGGKIRTFYSAWSKAGLQPTEVDYAFFVDRSAHMSPTEESLLLALKGAQDGMKGELSPAQFRRAVSLAVLPLNRDQRKSRLGRDVTFYIDELADQLSKEESTAWADGKQLRASDTGLSDLRSAPAFQAEATISWRPAGRESLTIREASSCPAAVLDPLSPAK